jgi:DNA-binding protein HU-beta
MRHYYCTANDSEGIEITPRTLSRVTQGKYCVPDCVDYESRFNIPRKIKAKEIYTGWNCHNCRFLKETQTPKKPPTGSPPPPSPPSETVTREELSKQVSSKSGISQRRVDKIIVNALSTITRSLGQHQNVKLEDFGKFEVKMRKGWNGRHPGSGEETPVPDRPTIRFKPGKSLKQKLAYFDEDTAIVAPDET